MKALLAALFILGTSVVGAAEGPARIRATRLSLAGISLGASEDQVRAAFGKPLEVTVVESEANSRTEREFKFKGVSVYFVNDEAYNVRCTSTEFATQDGVRVGDPASRAIAVYGQPEIIERDDEVLYRYRVDGTDMSLLFLVRRGEIDVIELWFDWT